MLMSISYAALTPELADHLAVLYAHDLPVSIRLRAVLAGLIQGRVLADHPSRPTFACVQELTESNVYITAAANPEQLAEAFQILSQDAEIVVGLWPDDPLCVCLPAGQYYEGSAIDFLDRSIRFDLDRMGQVPAGCQLCRVEPYILPLMEGFDYYISMFGTSEAALRNTLGYCLMQDGKVVSEAVAGPLLCGMAELGVGTSAAYRGKGYGLVVSARVIQACEALGYQPFWNAAAHNAASVALARRLGFQTQKAFKVLAWPRQERAA